MGLLFEIVLPYINNLDSLSGVFTVSSVTCREL